MRPTFPPPRRSLPRICFLGDAFTVGAGDETALGWVGRVVQVAWQRHHDVTISHLGTRGASTHVLLRRWRQECEARLPRGCAATLQLTPAVAGSGAHQRDGLREAVAAMYAGDDGRIDRPRMDAASGAALSRATVAAALNGVRGEQG